VLASSEVLVAQRTAASRVQLPKTDVQIAGGSPTIAYDRQEWREDGKAHHAGRLSSNDVSRDRSNAPTNARQIQHWADDLDRRLAAHQRGAGARLVQVITQSGIGLRLARVRPQTTRAYERQLKNRHGASRYCPICQDQRKAHGHDHQQQPRAGAVPTRGVRPGQARAFMALNPSFGRPVSASLAEKWSRLRGREEIEALGPRVSGARFEENQQLSQQRTVAITRRAVQARIQARQRQLADHAEQARTRAVAAHTHQRLANAGREHTGGRAAPRERSQPPSQRREGGHETP
jgi:hypothetical protein